MLAEQVWSSHNRALRSNVALSTFLTLKITHLKDKKLKRLAKIEEIEGKKEERKEREKGRRKGGGLGMGEGE